MDGLSARRAFATRRRTLHGQFTRQNHQEIFGDLTLAERETLMRLLGKAKARRAMADGEKQ